MGMDNGKLLDPKGTRPHRRRQVRTRSRWEDTEQLRGADPLARAYERGPFPVQTVETVPQALLQIVERRTGTRLDPDVVAELERVRLFMGWQGFPLTPELQAQRWLSDPTEDKRPPAPEPAPVGTDLAVRPAPVVPPGGMPGGLDPLALGED